MKVAVFSSKIKRIREKKEYVEEAGKNDINREL